MKIMKKLFQLAGALMVLVSILNSENALGKTFTKSKIIAGLKIGTDKVFNLKSPYVIYLNSKKSPVSEEMQLKLGYPLQDVQKFILDKMGDSLLIKNIMTQEVEHGNFSYSIRSIINDLSRRPYLTQELVCKLVPDPDKIKNMKYPFEKEINFKEGAGLELDKQVILMELFITRLNLFEKELKEVTFKWLPKIEARDMLFILIEQLRIIVSKIDMATRYIECLGRPSLMDIVKCPNPANVRFALDPNIVKSRTNLP